MLKKIFVVGATGIQGYPATKALLEAGFQVKGLVAKTDSKSIELEKLGACIVEGNLFDAESLYKHMRGMQGVLFIPVIPTSGSPLPEYTVGYNVVTAAERAGIEYMIHTSVDRAGEHENFTEWGKNFNSEIRYYWLAKSAVIDIVKASKIAHWSILKPAYLMECFLPPKVYGMYPLLKDGKLISSRNPETKLTMTSADVQAKLIVKVFENFTSFDHKEIGLASVSLTMSEIAETFTKVLGKKVIAEYWTPEKQLNDEHLKNAIMNAYKGYEGINIENLLSAMMSCYEWDNTDGYTANPKNLEEYGVQQTFEEWIEKHREEFDID